MFGHFNKFAFILTEQHLQMFSNNQWPTIIYNTETVCLNSEIVIQYLLTKKGTMRRYPT